MDPLSEIIRSVRLSGGIFIDAHFTAPWSILAQVSAEDCRLAAVTSPVQLIGYHFVTEGTLLASLEEGQTIEIGAGEAVLFPRNDMHILASARGLPSCNADELIQPLPNGRLARIAHGGGGADTRLICGFLASESLYNPLITALPGMLKVEVRDNALRDWVATSVRFAAAELATGRLPSSDLISRLSELLLVEAVRNYAAALNERETGWLRGLTDPQIGKALALIHRDPAAPWSAEGLAREVALSRSAFVERFTALVGAPPIRYLTAWRLQTAKLTLREAKTTIARLAHSVGYESEEAFSRAFKREFGMSPTHWRDQYA